MYLMIQNKGVAPVEAFTLLGASITRDSGTVGAIGQFGTGTKQSINLLLRKRMPFRIYCGRTRLDFETEPYNMKDDLESQVVDKVFCKFSGTSRKRIDLGWVLEFGALDWDETEMALREFISNAIDRTIREFGDFIPSIRSGDLTVTCVDDNQVKARSGYTRVFIKVDEDGEVLRYLAELPKRFLHFSSRPGLVQQGLLPKDGRNLSEGCRTPMIYREGVFVAEIEETASPSVYDYNFTADEIEIDESRNSSEYTIRAACAQRLRVAEAAELIPVFQALTNGEATFEAALDAYYLLSPYIEAKDQEKSHWQEAWQAALGDKAVAAESGEPSHAKTYAARKGHDVQELPKPWASVAGRFGITTTATVLNENERKGREILAATQAAETARDKVWEWCELTQLTNGKSKPRIKCYRELTDAESDLMGFHQIGTDLICTRDDISSGENKYLLKAVLEETGHYITGSTDMSRDFQNFFIDMIVAFAE